MSFEDMYLLLMALLIAITIVGIAIFMQGCTTTSHEPECKCKCTEVDATFECGGLHYSQELEIK